MSLISRQGFATAPDGTPIFYSVYGPSGAPVLALSDGIGCDGYVWKYLRHELANEFCMVHWHYPGHGRSPAPEDQERVGIPDLADALDAVLKAAVGDEAAVLCGHSMGVQVSLETFRRHRARVRGLVLICGSYGFPLRTFKGKRTLEQALPYLQFLVRRIPKVAANISQFVLPTELAYQIATKFELNGALIRREDFFPYLEHMARVDLRMFMDMLAAAGRHSAREILPQIDVPTLIVAGDRDGFTPPQLSEDMHRSIPGSELFVVRGGSHTAPLERPAEVSACVRTFLHAHGLAPKTPQSAA